LAMYRIVNAATLPNNECAPERTMWFAVLNQAVSDALGNSKANRADARRFMFTQDFEGLCCLFDLNPEYVRREVFAVEMEAAA
jgi:hypothetical protein